MGDIIMGLLIFAALAVLIIFTSPTKVSELSAKTRYKTTAKLDEQIKKRKSIAQAAREQQELIKKDNTVIF